MIFIFFILIGYLLGSIPFGKIIARKYGIDLQKKGSGNIGFTNTLRTIGLKPAIPVLIGDVLKGFIPTFLALRTFTLNEALIVALVAILGHIFPIWLKFKGGKGAATGLGVTLAISPIITMIGMAVFLIVFFVTKIVSLSSILGTSALSIISYFVFPKLTIFYLTLLLIVTWTHRENIKRLLSGKEKRI